MDAYVGGIEAGGTKFVCAVGSGPDDVRADNIEAKYDNGHLKITLPKVEAKVARKIEVKV